MKLFRSHLKEVKHYLEQPIHDTDIELEVIFGLTPNDSPMNKSIFMKVLEKCRNTYQKLSETIDLDIRTEYNRNPSNVRATIHGLDSIKQYCKQESFDDIQNVEYIQKKNIRNFNPLKDEDYNLRLTIKQENKLDEKHHFVRSFKENYSNKLKHYRYKKRFSFITDDKLFRIDLTIVKATRFNNNHSKKYGYDFQKTFQKANILNNREVYELEIEYIGWMKDIGIPAIDNLFHKKYEITEKPEIGVLGIGNIYDPLQLGIKMDHHISYSEPTFYDPVSPRFDDSKNPTLLMSYTD